MSPICPSAMRSCSSMRGLACRDMSPTPTFRFFADASSASLSRRRLEAPSAESGFSMKTFRPFLIAYSNMTGRNASGVAKIATSPGESTSIACL